MSSSDVRMLEELTARVAALEAAIDARLGLMRPKYDKLRADVDALMALLPKDVSGELYGAAPDHAADREARAAMVRRPLREPQDKLPRPA